MIPARPWLCALALLASSCAEDAQPKTRPITAPPSTMPNVAGAPAAPPASSRPRVTLNEGTLEGQWTKTGARAFLGIPFARPPIDTLRWAPPEPAAWSGVRDAIQFGPRCPQPPSTDPLNVASEDCLYLNVWAPADAVDLPVMVWIHGGGNVNGSSSEGGYDGQHLASRFNVVLVSINYRLGVFGFFAHEAGPTGNQGLWDQQLALRWVQTNIDKFGGDASNVTIFGESAGSTDVCMHVASPHSRGLFHRAISQSGSCTTRRTSLAGAQRTAATFATKVGCDTGDALACLRAKSIGELIDAASGFGPIVDGTFMPEEPRALFDRGEIARVPYMLGSTSDEGSYWTLDDTGITNDEQYFEALRRRFPDPVEPIAAIYPASKFAEAKNPYQAALTRAFGDGRLVCSTYDAAIRATELGLPVFTYNFDVAVDDVVGAAHAAELVFVFGTIPVPTPETKLVSDRMMGYWTQFARAGDPNGDPLLNWPSFTETSDRRLNFGLESSIVDDFRAEECAFWRTRYDEAFNAAAP